MKTSECIDNEVTNPSVGGGSYNIGVFDSPTHAIGFDEYCVVAEKSSSTQDI